ncbi:MAG: TraB/GumN family protein [Planctomycetota bacterium]
MALQASIACLCLLLASACTSAEVGRARMQAVIDEHASRIDAAMAPKFLADRWREHRVLLLGETHYVEEHHALIGGLLTELAAGRRVQVLAEGLHAYGWVLDDYVQGRREDLPRRVRMFQGAWADAVRRFNHGRPDELRIHCSNVDMNHGAEDFIESTKLLRGVIAPLTIFDRLHGLDPHAAEYPGELEAVARQLESTRDELRSRWGAAWHDRIVEMVAVERASDDLRRSFLNEGREQLMIDASARRIRGFDGMTVILCGMNHAQKRQSIYRQEMLLGTSLREEFAETFSVAFVPIRGEVKRRFYDEDSYAVDVLATAPPEDLVRILGERAADGIGYLPLRDPVFQKSAWIHLALESRLLVPADAFDAIVSYPQASVLASLR